MKDKPDDQSHKGIGEVTKSVRKSFRNLRTVLHDKYFVRDVDNCPYYNRELDSFGIMLKGKSLEQFPKYDKEFENCFLVNNFDKELKAIGDSLIGKKCVHFVNRVKTTTPLQPENYKKLNITEIQLPKVSAVGDNTLRQSINHYKSLGLKTHYLPKHLLKFNNVFGPEYARKYPNTGILAIIYTLEILRPKTLWIVGLDFYQSDYLFRRPHQSTIEVQRAKMNRTNLVEITAAIFQQYPEVDIKMVSYFKGFPEVQNVTFMDNNI